MFDGENFCLSIAFLLLRAAQLALVGLLCGLIVGCDRTEKHSVEAKSPKVASLVPAATDLIVAMGAGDHLVGVSDYDHDSAVAKLPRVGAYQTIDWEKLSLLHPNVLISLYGPGHIPPGFIERANSLGIENMNLRLNRLDDIYVAAVSLGDKCGESTKATALVKQMREGMEAVRRRWTGDPPVRALIVLGPGGMDVVSTETFFDDLLQSAGGRNVVKSRGYPTLDREALAALRPRVVLQLMPGADEKTISQAKANWQSLVDLPAVREQRIWIFTDPWIMEPGSHVVEIAQKFAAALHPDKEPESHPSTTQPTQ